MAAIVERLRCPPRFQERLTRAGGLNRYGAPNFKLAWGQSLTARRGGRWASGEWYYEGYRDELTDGRPCWILVGWQPPEVYGTPERWFRDNVCPVTGLQLLADFPWHGNYETLQPLVWRGFANGALVVEHLPLCGLIIDYLIPMVQEWQKLTTWRKQVAFLALEEQKQRDESRAIADARQDANLAFRGPVSFSRQGCRTSLIDQRMKVISDHWNQAADLIHRQGLGITIH